MVITLLITKTVFVLGWKNLDCKKAAFKVGYIVNTWTLTDDKSESLEKHKKSPRQRLV